MKQAWQGLSDRLYIGLFQRSEKRVTFAGVKQMHIFYSLLQYIFLFVLLMVPGYLMGRKGTIHDSGVHVLTNILTDIAMLFLVFSKLLKMDLDILEIPSVICCFLFPILSIVGTYLISLLVFPKTGKKDRYTVNRFCSIMPNCGFIGLPLAAAVFPDNPEVVLYISIFNLLSTYLLLSLGTYVLSEDRGEIKLQRLLCHPILFSIVLGLICSRLPDGIVEFIEDYAVMPAQLCTPVSMLILGYRLSKLSVRGVIGRADLAMSIGMKLIVMPFLTIAVMYVLKLCGVPLDHGLVMAMLIATAVPVAGSAPALAQRYARDAEHSAACTIGSALCSIITIPVIYLLVLVLFP